jgi:hypothetical protein
MATKFSLAGAYEGLFGRFIQSINAFDKYYSYDTLDIIQALI